MHRKMGRVAGHIYVEDADARRALSDVHKPRHT